MAFNTRPLSDSFALVSRLDPSLDAPAPLAPLAEDADEAARAAHAAALKPIEEWEHRWTVACETLNFSPLLKPGEKPTVFRFRPIAGSVMRRMVDLLGSDFGQLHAEVAFRLSLVAIDNLAIEGAPKVERATDADLPQLGPMVKRDVVDFLDQVAAALGQPFGALVHELGLAVLTRSLTPSGK